MSLALIFSARVVASAPPAVLPAAVNLNAATGFAVLAGTPAITNAGPSAISGNVGISPAAAVTGFPPGDAVSGAIEAATATAAHAKADLTAAYIAAAGSACDSDRTGQNLGGQTLVAATYCQSTAPTLTGTLTLSGKGVFIFQVGSTLVTAPGARVILANGADACDVYWQVGSSATLDTTTTFAGTIMALADITVNDGATVTGRLLARNGQVTLINDRITVPACTSTPTPLPPPPPAPTPITTLAGTSRTTGPPSLWCPAAGCPTPTASPVSGAATVTGPSPGPGSRPPAAAGGEVGGPIVATPTPFAVTNLAPAPVLDTQHFPWLWPLLAVVNLLLLGAIVVALRRTGNRPPGGGATP